MPLSDQDQVTLLKDILTDHQTDCCGSVSECEQLDRLVSSLIDNSNINQNVKSILKKIQTYSQSGIHAANLNQHIEASQQSISSWVNDIDEFS